ncbi:hypothetical protein QAD02_004866 [Eretmocerus hayati]|uniref:Uncharacterized protein n=1 Tax=Eretmocerus hayati TaxID=131215 RepID=A0ACC2NR74_9HYME|nr:hypothetical protein QAD02_004866 [Eretmocerus hayati]
MHYSARYNPWHQPDRNDYTQDWEPDQQSAWGSAAEQVPQQYNKHPPTQIRRNNEERIPQQYNNTQNRENNQERTQQQYNKHPPTQIRRNNEERIPQQYSTTQYRENNQERTQPCQQQYSPQPSTQNRETNQERMLQQYYPQPSTQNRGNEEESNPQPRPIEYAPEWYLPHRNTLPGSQSTPNNNHTVIGNRQDLYYHQVQYSTRNDEKMDEYVDDVYGYNGEAVDGGTYEVSQQTGNSIQDPFLLAKAQKELQKVYSTKEYNTFQGKKSKAKKRAKLKAKKKALQSGTQTQEDIAGSKTTRKEKAALKNQTKRPSKAERLAALSPAAWEHRERQMRAKDRKKALAAGLPDPFTQIFG